MSISHNYDSRGNLMWIETDHAVWIGNGQPGHIALWEVDDDRRPFRRLRPGPLTQSLANVDPEDYWPLGDRDVKPDRPLQSVAEYDTEWPGAGYLQPLWYVIVLGVGVAIGVMW